MSAGLVHALLLSLPAPAAAFDPPYESLNAVALLSERSLRGPDYQIQTEVVNRGLMNHYVIDTAYGRMRARSDRKLRQRLGEIRALRELNRMHEGRLIAESVGRSFLGTARSVARVIKDPLGTAEDVQQGISHLLRRGGRRTRNAYRVLKQTVGGKENDAAGPGDGTSLPDKTMRASRRFARNRLGVSRAYRDLAREVGVDPYTDNVILHKELDRLAKHSAGASLGSKLVIPRIPSLIGTVENVSDLVWNKDALDLLLHNEDTLAGLAVPDAVVRRFLENETYSPTQQTAIVSTVATMKDVTNYWRLIEYAGYADTAAEADFYTDLIALLALYHQERAVLDTIHPTATIVPAALTRDHRAVVIFPVDRLRWTRDVDGIVATLTGSHAGRMQHREIWITGEVSQQANEVLSRHDWIPFTRARQRLADR